MLSEDRTNFAIFVEGLRISFWKRQNVTGIRCMCMCACVPVSGALDPMELRERAVELWMFLLYIYVTTTGNTISCLYRVVFFF